MEVESLGASLHCLGACPNLEQLRRFDMMKDHLHYDKIGHIRYINILACVRGFQGKIATFFCLTIPKRDLDTKKTTPNIEVCLESLGGTLKY